QRQVIHDNTCSATQWDTTYDFIVVGGGTAGAIVANKLSLNKSTRVIVLESGGPQSALYNDIPAMNHKAVGMTALNWYYYYQPNKNYGKQFAGGKVPENAGKTLGGSSAHNGMGFIRGNSRDYDEWANTYGAVGWSYRDVLPVFREWENNTNPIIVHNEPEYHGTRGPIQISTPNNPDAILFKYFNAFNELGYKETDINGPNQTGYAISQSFLGLRTGTGNIFVDPNPHPDNLQIVCKALVTKILFNGLTAIGVEFIVNDISYTVYANKEVIVSGGAIQSPQLLLLSGIGPKQHLKRFKIPVVLDLPVGLNFQNHPVVDLHAVLKPQYLSLINPIPEINVHQLSQLYYNRGGQLASLPLMTSYLNTRSNRDKEWPNVEIQVLRGNTPSITALINLVKSTSGGTIMLQSTDPLLPPLMDPNWYSNAADKANMLEAVTIMFYVHERTQLAHYIQPLPPFSAIGCPDCPDKQYLYECVDGLKCFIKYNTVTGGHPSGTCRMGAIERPDVVVDPQLRVKGAANLRVCDASVFPVIPNGNTASAAILVGYKCAQFIEHFYNL
ncbi:unnamed protein product, partial [Medioppia subpectinata]